MNRFRVPARSLFLASLGASMLAGFGVEAIRARSNREAGWGRLVGWAATSAGLAAILGLSGLFLRNAPSGEPCEIERLKLSLDRLCGEPSFWLALGVVPMGLSIAWKMKSSRNKIAIVLGLLGLIELGCHGQRLIVTTPASRYFGPDPISKVLEDARPSSLAPARIRVVDSLYDDLRASQHGFEKTNVNDSFQIQHAADLYETLYRQFDDDKFVGGAPMDAAAAQFRREVRQSVLDRMSVSFLVDDRIDPESSWPKIASGEWLNRQYVVYRNPTALPRAYVVPRAEVAPDDRFLIHQFRRVDPRQAVLMAFDPMPKSPSTRQPFTPADWTSNNPDRLVLKVSTTAPGLLVVADTWMPGWSAMVDGRGSPIFRGNRSQRVIPLVEAGQHEVILTYRTPGLSAGLSMTIGASVVWLALFLVVPRRVGSFLSRRD
jgi:hypothetical protein